MREKTRRALAEFVEKAQKLQRFGLIEHIRTTGRGFHINRGSQDSESVIVFDQPDEKERDASLLTFRMFIQQNENFSFHQFDSLASDPTLSNEFRDWLLQMRHAYFDYLNGYPKMILADFFEEGEHPNRHDILKIVMNGGISHANDYEKQKKYKLWARDDIRESVLLQEFSEIMLNILRMIISISEPIEREITQDVASQGTG
jgi:hypothetical protein